MFHGYNWSGSDGSDIPDGEPETGGEEGDIAEAVEMWEENVNRLERHGEEYKLSDALKKVALKIHIGGQDKGQV